jgi:SagB-type dehydrogenase family enzyme
VELATQRLHRLTSYEPSRDWTEPVDDPAVVQDLEVNDLSRLPWFMKRYPDGLPRVELPRDLPGTTAPAVAVLAGTAAVGPQELSLGHLARILYLSAGVVRTAERAYGTHLFRAAGSAGGRFPLELYVAVPDGGALPAGVHWYDPEGHALVQVGPAPLDGDVTVAVTGVPWRTGWRYRERGYRHVYWDLGTMLSQLTGAAASAGIPAALYSRFPDAAVAELVGADGVHEFPVAVVSLGGKAPALRPAGVAVAGAVDAAPLEFPLVTAAQQASAGDAVGRPWESGPTVDGAGGPSDPFETVVLARGSQRLMDPDRGLPERMLRDSVAVAVRGVDLPHFVVVHDVQGMEPGLYRWPELGKPVRPGNLRDELYRVCLEQALARDAAFVVITAADVSALDDAGYRAAQLGSGLVEGRLHLLAYAMGAGASGMTFLDSEIPALLGEPLEAMLFTCVGVPAYRSAKGGPPGRPTSVRPVVPR